MSEDKRDEELKEKSNQAKEKEAVAARPEGKPAGRSSRGDNRGRKPQGRKPSPSLGAELEERVVAVNRVAKVVKGGRRFSFSALIIVGDKKGSVGYGLGKAKEVPEAIRKGTQAAQRRMIKVPIEKGTIPHTILGEYDAGKVLFKPAAEGTGVKAAGACRSVLELAGVQNVLTKSLRGNNPHNIVKATFSALKSLRSVENIAKARGKNPEGLRLK